MEGPHDLEVVEIHGMHESQEGLCRWGFGVWDRDAAVLQPRMFNSWAEAEAYIRGDHEGG